MSTLSLGLPESLHEQKAKREEIYINQFVGLVPAENVSAWLTEECLNKSARRATQEKLQAVLDKVFEW